LLLFFFAILAVPNLDEKNAKRIFDVEANAALNINRYRQHEEL
jgi:hypothetical protein